MRVLIAGLFALALLLVAATGAQAYTVRGSVEQVYVTGATPGQQLTLLNGSGGSVATRTVNSLGATLFRNVSPGSGYRVRPAAGGPPSAPVTVLSTQPAPPSTSVYNQTLPSDGYGYLTTRDGTKLAVNVHPPPDVTDVLPCRASPCRPSPPGPRRR